MGCQRTVKAKCVAPCEWVVGKGCKDGKTSTPSKAKASKANEPKKANKKSSKMPFTPFDNPTPSKNRNPAVNQKLAIRLVKENAELHSIKNKLVSRVKDLVAENKSLQSSLKVVWSKLKTCNEKLLRQSKKT